METNEIIEELSEKVHDAWWAEKEKQGFHSPIECRKKKPTPAIGKSEAKELVFTKHCDKCHTDMYPYKDLPEHIKDYDRETVKAVLKALTDLGKQTTT